MWAGTVGATVEASCHLALTVFPQSSFWFAHNSPQVWNTDLHLVFSISPKSDSQEFLLDTGSLVNKASDLPLKLPTTEISQKDRKTQMLGHQSSLEMQLARQQNAEEGEPTPSNTTAKAEAINQLVSRKKNSRFQISPPKDRTTIEHWWPVKDCYTLSYLLIFATLWFSNELRLSQTNIKRWHCSRKTSGQIQVPNFTVEVNEKLWKHLVISATESAFKVKQEKWKQTAFKVELLGWRMSTAGCVLWNSVWCQNALVEISQDSFLCVQRDESDAGTPRHLPSHLSAQGDGYFSFCFWLSWRPITARELSETHWRKRHRTKTLFRWQRRLGPQAFLL